MDSFIEKVFCGRVIKERDTNNTLYTACGNKSLELEEEVNALGASVINITRERDAILASTQASQKQNAQIIANLESEKSSLVTQVSSLQAQLNSQITYDPGHSMTFPSLPQSTQNTLNAYMNKYPEAFITYSGRYWGTNKNRYPLDLKAWLTQGINDWEIVSMVKSCKGRVQDVLTEQPNLTFHQACDKAYMRITHSLGDSISYQYDTRAWGENEFWQFASETRVMRTGDCEDKAILNHIGARIAGIPYEMLRITAGMTFGGEGHCTNFYYASDNKWHHRNSTSNYSADKTVTSLPSPGDSGESLNIQNPWFSATDSKTFNWWGTEAEKREAKTLKNEPFFKFLKINARGRRP